MPPYLVLATAIVAELVGTMALKYSDGFTRLAPSLCVMVGYTVAFVALAQSVKVLPVGTVYAIWAGVGVAASRLLASYLFQEPMDATVLGGTALVMAGVVLLSVSSGSGESLH